MPFGVKAAWLGDSLIVGNGNGFSYKLDVSEIVSSSQPGGEFVVQVKSLVRFTEQHLESFALAQKCSNKDRHFSVDNRRCIISAGE